MRKDLLTITDELLFSQVSNGDDSAFGVLYDRHWNKAFTEAYVLLKNIDQAKDIVQDTFINLWLKREKLQIDNFQAYLATSIRNRVFNFVCRQPDHIFFDKLKSLSSNTTADGNLLWKEFEAGYNALIEKLPPKRREIFRAKFQDNLSADAIARNLNLSRKTIYNQLERAVSQLRMAISHLLTFIMALTQIF